MSKPDCGSVLSGRKVIELATERRKRNQRQTVNWRHGAPVNRERDEGYNEGLRAAMEVIDGIRPIADQLGTKSCLDGISAIFDSMADGRA